MGGGAAADSDVCKRLPAFDRPKCAYNPQALVRHAPFQLEAVVFKHGSFI